MLHVSEQISFGLGLEPCNDGQRCGALLFLSEQHLKITNYLFMSVSCGRAASCLCQFDLFGERDRGAS
jgi:hypothetical protein